MHHGRYGWSAVTVLDGPVDRWCCGCGIGPLRPVADSQISWFSLAESTRSGIPLVVPAVTTELLPAGFVADSGWAGSAR
jgi:hypothetical protein